MAENAKIIYKTVKFDEINEKVMFRHNFYGIFGRGKKVPEIPKIWPAYLFFELLPY